MTNKIDQKSTQDTRSLYKESGTATFLILTFLFSAVFYTLIITSGRTGGGGGRYATGIMWCPGFAALLTCHMHRIPISFLGWRWAGFQAQGASFLLPIVYSFVAYLIVWTTQLGSFPNPTFLHDSVASVGIGGMSPWFAVILTVFLESVFGFIRSCANALGEEIGWRGFLTPMLVRRRGFTVASLSTGCIWAAWHYPILLFADYNLGTPGWYALSCFTIMILGLSVIYTWFRLKTGSLWTATFLHASHNLIIQAVFTPLTADTGVTRYAIDEFGFVLPAVIGATAIWFWQKREVALKAWQESSPRCAPPNSNKNVK